jgi:hypothetical protein
MFRESNLAYKDIRTRRYPAICISENNICFYDRYRDNYTWYIYKDYDDEYDPLLCMSRLDDLHTLTDMINIIVPGLCSKCSMLESIRNLLSRVGYQNILLKSSILYSIDRETILVFNEGMDTMIILRELIPLLWK